MAIDLRRLFALQLERGIQFRWTWRFSGTGAPMNKWNFFNEKDDPLIVGLDTELMAKLDLARSKAGVPFRITSGLRTQDQNAALNGAAKDSPHLKGLAVDVSVSGDARILNRVLFGLFAAGFDRIGIYFRAEGKKLIPVHIHVDLDSSKAPCVTWCELEQN